MFWEKKINKNTNSMFKKLRNRLLAINMIIISVVMFAAFSVIYAITYTNVQNENLSKLDRMPFIIAPSTAYTRHEQLPNQSGEIISRVIPKDYTLSFSVITDEDGNVMEISSLIDMQEEEYLDAIQIAFNNTNPTGSFMIDGRNWMYKTSSFIGMQLVQNNNIGQSILYGDNYYQIAFLDITESVRSMTQLLITFIIVSISVLFVIFGVSFYFANRSIRPISENWEKQKQFIADASHELRTPLTIINANSDVLISNEDETVKSQKKWINYIKAETNRMAKLAQDLLYLAKAEDSEKNIPDIAFDISRAVNNIILSMEAVVFEKNIELTHNIEPEIQFKGDCEKIERAVMILLDNAIKYTDEKGFIDISLKKIKRQIIFSIKNSGKGIDGQELQKVFDRFYRTDPSRNSENGGYGLGLPIAKAILEKSGGKIYVQSIKDESTTFTFTLKI